MRGWLKDLRLAARSLGRSPGFTAVAVATLGLAIGINAGIFTVVDAVLLEPLPYQHSDRLVWIGASAPGSDFPEEFGVSAEFFVQYSEESDLLEDLSTYNQYTSTLRVGDRTERIWMSSPTSSLFTTVGATPLLGRLPVPEDEDGVVVISHTLWTTWFGSDPEVIGQSYYVSGRDRTVIGVMGPDFWFPDDRVLLWYPQPIRAEGIEPGRFGMPLVGRVKPGVTEAALVAELEALARRLPARFGGSSNYARIIEQHRAVVRPLEEQLLGNVAGPLWVLLGSVGIVLLIACANVANLFLVRAERQQRDLAVRRAIGAARYQLIRSQMTEALVVAAFAGPIAVALALVSVPLFLQVAPPDVPRLSEAAVTTPTLLFTLVTSLVAALLCGLVPAAQASKPSLARLRDGSRGSTRRRHPARDGLVVAQTALALVLLIGSALLVRSFDALRNVDPGYDTEDVFTFQIAPEGEHLTDGPSFARFHMEFRDRLAALPGVESVGIVENVPLNEGLSTTRWVTEETASDDDGGTLLSFTFAAGDYFGTMGIDVLRGRAFTDADHVLGPSSVLVSQSAAELLWPGEDAIAKRVKTPAGETWATVVGVVDDVLQYNFRQAPDPMLYFPLVGPTPTEWVISSPAYVLKTRRAGAIAPEVLALVREVAPQAPMYRVFTMDGLAADSMVRLTFTMITLGIASLLALILGMIGLYGVLSYVVAQRTREIGVRMALGAEARRVRGMVVVEGIRVVVVGVVIGAVVALVASRALSTLLYDVQAVDPVTFLGMSGIMVLVGMAASYVPAWRASTVDPIESLRSD